MEIEKHGNIEKLFKFEIFFEILNKGFKFKSFKKIKNLEKKTFEKILEFWKNLEIWKKFCKFEKNLEIW